MNIIKNTWHIVDDFIKSPSYVFIDRDQALELAKKVKYYKANSKEFFMGEPKWMEHVNWDKRDFLDKIVELINYELILDSINYNYWYGKGTIRPNGASSYELSKLLDKAFLQNHAKGYISAEIICNEVIDTFKEEITRERYPNLENRLRHLEQVRDAINRKAVTGSILGPLSRNEEHDAEKTLRELMTIPSYASDMFLKRAFLFIIEMNRRMGWFKEDICKIPIPADYQIPKMLRSKGVLEYSTDLADKVNNHELIFSGSLMECEIRASAMEACRIVAEYAEVNMADVDTYLFANRKSCNDPFHLTITTDY